MIAAQDQREVSGTGDMSDTFAQLDTSRLDELVELGARVTDRPTFGPGHRDVLIVGHLQAHGFEVVCETGIADREWAHIDAPPASAEIHRHSDDADLACRD